tara:strand:- start:508 stop:675 length:168 start_codon:yes stop_codon:yes gene_type:complete
MTIKKEWKTDVMNILLVLGSLIITVLAFNYFNPSIEKMLSAIIFINTNLIKTKIK